MAVFPDVIPAHISESTDGVPVVVGTSLTLLHTAVGTAGQFDDVTIWAANTTGAPIDMTLSYGGVAFALLTIESHFAPAIIFTGRMGNSTLLQATGAAVGLRAGGWVDRKVAN